MCPSLQPNTIMKDLELATLNAAETVFPRASLVKRPEMEEGNQDIRYSSGIYANEWRLVPRTKNHMEGWHNRFDNVTNSLHPSFWKYFLLLNREIDLTKKDLVHSNSNR